MAWLLPHDTKPLSSLTALFTAWKGFLLAVSLGAALGPDYDTSTSLFFEHTFGRGVRVPALAGRLTRWDALYFVYASRHGYVYEQQWAFAAGVPLLVQRALSLLRSWGFCLGDEGEVVWEPLLAIAFAHATHLFAALVLYRLTVVLFHDRKLAFATSTLHILSPAGLFLSAPYAESPFALLSFLGYLLFAEGTKHGPTSLRRNAGIVGAGVVFGLSMSFRSNGLLNGILFAVEAIKCLRDLVQKPGFAVLLTGIAPVVGGLCLAAGSIVPQAIAWRSYCYHPILDQGLGEADSRPWCHQRIPSIYSYVQDVYWNNGFLRYWTPAQIPLFLLASPMLAILIKSSLSLLQSSGPSHGTVQRPASESTGEKEDDEGVSHRILVYALAAIQCTVAILAITNFHVQIITRISSGYPVWYWWVAGCLLGDDEKLRSRGSLIVVFMVMYAGVQGALFASFLPPA